MGTNECSQSASKSSWDSQDFGDIRMVLKMVHFCKSSRPQWVKLIHMPGTFWSCNDLSLNTGLNSKELEWNLNQQPQIFLTKYIWKCHLHNINHSSQPSVVSDSYMDQ